MNFAERKSEFLSALFAIRIFEEKIAQVYSQEVIRCPVHLAIGHEAVAVGVCHNLATSDLVYSYHRSHHHYLAKGGSEQKLLWELLGDARGCSRGRGGSTHLTAPEVGFVASTAIISGTIPVATGHAHALKLNGKNQICTVFCGDAAIEEGVFFESLNIAKLWELPVLFVIEDNDLSCYTDRITRQAHKSFAAVAELFNVPTTSVDGSDAETMFLAARKAIEYVRENSAPFVLHAKVYRALEHCGPEKDDLLAYRSTDTMWPALDPLFKLRKHFSADEFGRLETAVRGRLESLFEKSILEAKK